MAIKIGIYGYGNLGKGVECALSSNKDMELVGIFTRRDPASVDTISGAKVYSASEVMNYKDKIDVMILCGGSKSDLPIQTPMLARDFNVIDSFDTHADILKHIDAVDVRAREGEKLAIISAGWDPGMFSINRLYSRCILPEGSDYTFWGKGVSQGHSDAIRRIDGVIDGKQYTIPIQEALDSVRGGSRPELTTSQKHRRECFVVVDERADKASIEMQIKTMPNYFADYETIVHFISMEELQSEHVGIPHGGMVIRSGVSGKEGENIQLIEYSLKLDSNPEFTGSVLVAYARAAYRLHLMGDSGCKTVLDISPMLLVEADRESVIKNLL